MAFTGATLGLFVVFVGCSMLPAPAPGLQGASGVDPSSTPHGHPLFAPEVCPKEGTSIRAPRALPFIGWGCGWPPDGH